MNRAVNNILKILSGTFISRISGLVREIVISRFFGTSKVADAVMLAITFPSLFRQILGEDMVERAFMPPFKLKYMKNKNSGWRFISSTFNIFFIVLIIATLFLYIALPIFFKLGDYFPSIFGWAFGNNKNFDYQLTLNLSLIMLPFMIFIGLAAFLGGVLNFLEKNWIFGFAPVFLNLGIILSILLFSESLGGFSLAIGFLIGGVSQFLVQLPSLLNKKFKKNTKFRYYKSLTLEKEDKVSIKKESFIIGLNSIFNKSSEVINKILASTLITGSLSSLTYATRFFQLPHAILSLSIARGIIPIISEIDFKKEKDKFNNAFSKGLLLYFVVLTPALFLMLINSEEIIYIFYKGNQFDNKSVILTSNALFYFSWGILPLGIYSYFIRIASLIKQNKKTLLISIIGSISNIIISLSLIKLFKFGHIGIAISTSASTYINALLLYLSLKKEGVQFKKDLYSLIGRYVVVSAINIAIVLSITVFYINYTYDSKLEAIFSILINTTLLISFYAIYIAWDNRIKDLFVSVLKRETVKKSNEN